MSAKLSIKLNSKQEKAYSYLARGENIFLTGPAGTGKCLGLNTPIIMFDGTIKMVQDIKSGELIMGNDSTARTVLSITSGEDEMYKVTTLKGDSYVVNSAHILTFKSIKIIRIKNGEYCLSWGDKSGRVQYKSFNTKAEAENFSNQLPELLDLPILECIKKNKIGNWSKYFQGVYTELNFPEKSFELCPYILGLWLGVNEVLSKPDIITNEEFTKKLNKYFESNNFMLYNGNINYEKVNIRCNKILYQLRSLNVLNNKHIPQEYKICSRVQRIELLLGILGVDSLDICKCYEIMEKNKILAKDIYFVAKSVGFQVDMNNFIKCSTYKGEIYEELYYHIMIFVNRYQIPDPKFTKEINNHLFSPINIESIGKGTYYGFELDGNHRFVLGNFIVTHNTSVIKMFVKEYHLSRQIAVTSTTGTSALLLNGTTIHSYLGIGFGKESVDALVRKICGWGWIYKRWINLECLLIDEISMLDPNLFDKIEEIARIIRNDKRPFGGVQLVISGDFLQLPCVGTNNFCFNAKAWNKCIKHTIHLEEIIRQGDTIFQEVLNSIRVGNITKNVKKILNSRIGAKLDNEYGIKPTKLYSMNCDVDRVNDKELDKLAEDGRYFYEYNMKINVNSSVSNKSAVKDKFLKNCIAQKVLQLCIGAQVMLLKNLDIQNGLANGSRGVVTSFVDDMPMVRFLNGMECVIEYDTWEITENDKKILSVKQIPLKVAYAISIHKSQGCSLDYVKIDLSGVFEYGQAYVALSRVKSLKGLSIISIDYDCIQGHPEAVAYYESLL